MNLNTLKGWPLEWLRRPDKPSLKFVGGVPTYKHLLIFLPDVSLELPFSAAILTRRTQRRTQAVTDSVGASRQIGIRRTQRRTQAVTDSVGASTQIGIHPPSTLFFFFFLWRLGFAQEVGLFELKLCEEHAHLCNMQNMTCRISVVGIEGSTLMTNL